MADEFTFIRFKDPDADAAIRAIAKADRRSIGDTVALLALAEYARRFSTPQPLVTVEQAQAAAEQSK